MIKAFGSEIAGVYTEGHKVEAIYTGGVKVWPSTPVSSVYYIRWWPKSASGEFTINGETHYLEDYNGYYSGPFLTTSITSPYGTSYVVSYIDSGAFAGTSIIGVETNLVYVSHNAFADCTELKYVSMPKVSVMRAEVFSSCTSLTYIELPNLWEMPLYGFNYCTNLRDASFAKCIRMVPNMFQGEAFHYCSNLTNVYMPMCSNLGSYAFANCGLISIELPACRVIQEYAFQSCSRFRTLVLEGSSVVTLYDSAFSGTRMSTSVGSIYVPSSLVSAYKTASRWSDYASHIYPIKD